MAKYGRGAVSAQLNSQVERLTASNSLPFKDALSSEHLTDVLAAASIDYRERVFFPSNYAARLHGAGPLRRSVLPTGCASRKHRTRRQRSEASFGGYWSLLQGPRQIA